MVIKLIQTPAGFVDPDDIDHSADRPSGPAAPFDGSCRVSTGPLRWSSSTGEVASIGVVRHVHSDNGVSGGSVMDTLRAGAQPSVQLVPGDESSRTSLRAAELLGVIEKRDGRYQDRQTVGTEAPGKPSQVALTAAIEAEHHQQPEQQQQREEAETEGVFDAVEDAAWQAEMEPIPDYAFRAAAAGATKAVLLDGDLADAARTLTRDTGMSPDRARDVIENGIWAQTQIVERAIDKVGITQDTVEDFYASCRANPAQLQNAISYLLNGRDVRPFQQMAREFIAKKARGG